MESDQSDALVQDSRGESCLGTMVLISAILALLWRNQMARYIMKFVFFVVSSIIAATIFIPIMIFRPRNPKNALLPAWCCRMTANILRIFYKVKGHENIVPEGSGCLVLVNHQSCLDLIVLAHLWPIFSRSCVISKREIFWIWPFGLATWLWGTVFIDRLNPEKAQDTINNTGEHISSTQARIIMFPEGTRHCGDTLLPFKKGAFHVALAAQCPIQPVVVSKYHFLDSKARRFDTGDIVIQILPAIPTKGVTREQLPELIDKVRNVMQNAYENISAETSTKKKV